MSYRDEINWKSNMLLYGGNCDTKTLMEKSKKLDDAIKVLKNEFVGIDEIIESIVSNIRPWYLFPELQDKPLVISLFGMTGCGKTSLVKRLSEILSIEEDYMYFNFAKIDEMSASDIDYMFENNFGKDKANRFIVYDEFQYAKTIDEEGNEKDNRSALKPFWELLDTGRFCKRLNMSDMNYLFNLGYYFDYMNNKWGIKVVDGKFVNKKDILLHMSFQEKEAIGDFINLDDKSETDDLLSSHTKWRILEIVPKIYGNLDMLYSKENKVFMDFCNRDAFEISNLFKKIFADGKKGYEVKFHQSVIFVLGNIDEAYEMSYDMDPDMSPDQFHELTKKISIVNVKDALKRRFRNEQIARLGNIIMAYPSFNSESFRKIISLELKKYSDSVYEKTGYNIIFDETINEVIYNNSVFPTQGTRPIFSTIHEIVKSKLPLIVERNFDNEFCANTFYYLFDFSSDETIVRIENKEGEEISRVKENLRIDKLRRGKSGEKQALVAVHETGHFIMHVIHREEVPEKICSKTASDYSDGFILGTLDDDNYVRSRDAILDDIEIALGGYAAEKMVFGDSKMSCGASSDIKKATEMAGDMVRKYGLYGLPVITTYTTANSDFGNGNGAYVREFNDNKDRLIEGIIDMCLKNVMETFKIEKWRNVLKDMSKYLSKHSTMSKKKMESILKKNVGIWKKNKNTYYRNAIEKI